MPEEREIYTKAGLLSGVINEWVDSYGNLLSCMFCKQNKLSSHENIFIPKYENTDFRTRYRDAVTFYKSGELKSVYLEEQQEIHTPIGKIPAEMVTFYKSGSLLRIFPIYGQISGYWSEKEEAEMLKPCSILVGSQKIRAKISGISFYESGAVKSITLFPGEIVTVSTPIGEVKVRFGISFYTNGAVESVEPDKPTVVNYDNCKFLAYDIHPIGIHGDKNSLSFYEDGKLKSLKTTVTAVTFYKVNEKFLIEPEARISQIDIETMEIIPITIKWRDKNICVTDSDGFVHNFDMEQYHTRTEQLYKNYTASQNCNDCSSCSYSSMCTI